MLKLSFDVLILFLLFAVTPPGNAQDAPALAQDTSRARIYIDPAERRQAGVPRQLTDWLAVSGLLESGPDYYNFRNYEIFVSAQVGFDLTFSDMITAELLVGYDNFDRYNFDDLYLDVATINFESESWGVSAGRQYLPFGAFYSHFVIGPIVGLFETRATSVNLEYWPDYFDDDTLELWASVFAGEARSIGIGGDSLDFGFGFEFSSDDETLTLGVGYLSDLAETIGLFEESFGDFSQERIPGLSAYARAGLDDFEITVEMAKAIGTVSEFDADLDKPWAWNVEVAYFPWPSMMVAARIEASEELFDEPERQYGLTATWRIREHVTLAADYLFGTFKRDFAFDNNGEELRSRNWIAAQISIEL